MPRPSGPCPPVSHLLAAIGLVCAPALVAGCSDRGPEMSADLVLLGGAVVTEDPAHPEAEAVAVRGDSILAVGRNDEVGRLAGPAARRIDLRGAMGGPGLIDAHGPVRSLGEELASPDLHGGTSGEGVARHGEATGAR